MTSREASQMKRPRWVVPDRASQVLRPTCAALVIGAALAWVTAVAGAQTVKPVSVWSGVYTAAQNKRGEEFHADVCAMCHGPRLNGAGQSEMPPSPRLQEAPFSGNGRASPLRRSSLSCVTRCRPTVRARSPTSKA